MQHSVTEACATWLRWITILFSMVWVCSPCSGCCDKHNRRQWNSVLRSYTPQAVYFSVRYVSVSLEFWRMQRQIQRDWLGGKECDVWGDRATHARTHTHTHNRFTTLFPGPPGWAGARRELLDFMVQGKINRGRHTDRPAGRHSIRTNQCPPPPSSLSMTFEN